ncbi:MAG TPA: hypothetical protein PKM88_12435, partial [bacterium]|nr:hypothetical protein [bacterium]
RILPPAISPVNDNILFCFSPAGNPRGLPAASTGHVSSALRPPHRQLPAPAKQVTLPPIRRYILRETLVPLVPGFILFSLLIMLERVRQLISLIAEPGHCHPVEGRSQPQNAEVLPQRRT